MFLNLEGYCFGLNFDLETWYLSFCLEAYIVSILTDRGFTLTV